MRNSFLLGFLVGLSIHSVGQPSKAPLQSLINAGGGTGAFYPSTNVPRHFSSIGQPMVMPRPNNLKNGGGVMNANELMFSGVDSSLPLFGTNRTAPTVSPGTPLPIDADFSDPQSQVIEAIVEYRSINSTSPGLKSVLLTKSTGDAWTGSIPASDIGELGIEYQFKIKNGASLWATSPEFFNVTITHTAGVPIVINTKYGLSQKNYRIIAIPFVLDPNTVDAIFSEKLGGYNEKVWRMYRYENPNMDQLEKTSIIEPGKGYWFLSTREPSSPFTATGATVPASIDEPYEITLNPGWNQIGNPYNFDISWEDVRDANPLLIDKLSVTARSYDGAQIEIDEIKKFEGAYVSFTGATQQAIEIPVTKNPTINGGRIASSRIKNPLDNEHWEVKFDLSNGHQLYNLGGIGMHPQASDGVDPHDDFNIPRFFDYLEVKHPKQLYDMTYTKDMVPTQGQYVWNFTTETNQPGDAITLEWDNSYFGNGNEQLWLMDVETGLVWDMRKTAMASINYSSIRRWRVAFGNERFVKEATLPEQNSLIVVYPNPVEDETFIEVAIAKPSFSKVEILDVNGKFSRLLVNQLLDKGRYAFQWDGTIGDSKAASGIYLIRFQSGNVVQSKRVIKK